MTGNETHFSITNKTKGNPPTGGLPFEDIKNEILGKSYELSLVFIEDKLSAQLNEKYRGEKGPTNVLSFPLSDTTGEIFIDVDAVNREHELFDRDPAHFVGYLLIHGLLHLKGYEHGSKMEEEERQIRQKFDI